MRRAAVAGHPVEHSLSPVLHRAAYGALGLTDWTYDRIDCDEAGLPALLDGLGPEWAGLSLTMPLKRAVLALADEVSDLARSVAAGNTLVWRDGRRWVDNTDVAGIRGALQEAGAVPAVSGRVLVLGAGGTAQAAVAALALLGQREPTVLVRAVGRAAALRDAAEQLGSRPRIVAGLDGAHLPAADLIISTLPGGAADRLRLGPGAGTAVVLDVVYAGWPTRLATTAAGQGAQVISGLPVLLHQAAAQVALMTGRPGPVEVMRSALQAATGVALG